MKVRVFKPKTVTVNNAILYYDNDSASDYGYVQVKCKKNKPK